MQNELFIQSHKIKCTSSTAIIIPCSHWKNLQTELATMCHMADFWQPVSENITIAEVRAVQTFIAKSPVGHWKIVCIPYADQFKAEVANSLLKLVEEPPANVYVIFLAETSHFLPTMQSRLQIVTPSNEFSGSDRWQKALRSRSVQNTEERKVLKHLLYWYPLAHATVNTETVLDPFTA
jgi:DNA polymerase III delta prime subunit